jgi:[FeFe] hydrogenase H-cluster maturation GTPase HydF
MNQTPKSLRLQMGLFGRVNTGKSSLLNLLTGQDAAMTSSQPGTTTDVVEKAMELLPLGPVLFLDTAGFEDESSLGPSREARTLLALRRCDVVMLVVEAGVWGAVEERLVRMARDLKIPLMIVVNKVDVKEPSQAEMEFFRKDGRQVLCANAVLPQGRDAFLDALKSALAAALPRSLEPPLLGDLLPAGGLAVMVVPIDLQAPKGRLILPQVQAIRDGLDHDASVMVVKEREWLTALDNLKRPPNLVVCDSQVVLKVAADTPPSVPLTTFSVLFSRYKGDLVTMARGAAAIHGLRSGDRVLVAEACTHHALADDIGRVKIPRWLRRFTGLDLTVDHCAHHDYPADLSSYRLVIHCGACMLNRREMLHRLRLSEEVAVPITNYGIAIAVLQGVVERALGPFPAAVLAYRDQVALEKDRMKTTFPAGLAEAGQEMRRMS